MVYYTLQTFAAPKEVPPRSHFKVAFNGVFSLTIHTSVML